MTFCPNCGNAIKEGERFCKGCGSAFNGGVGQGQPYASQPMYQQPMAPPRMNVMAVVGFVVSLVSLLLNFWGIVGICALIFSVVGLVQLGQQPGKGKGLAIAGTIIGGFSVLYGLYTILVFM